HIQAMYSRLLERGLAPRTVLHVHRVLRQALSHAMKWGLVVRNVADAIDPPRPARASVHALDPTNLARLLDAAEDSAYFSLFALAAYTGMRRGELVGLRWDAVDLDHSALSVTGTLQRVRHRGLIEEPPKTD